MTDNKSLTGALSSELKKKFEAGGGLDKFKAKKLLNTSIKFKEQKWLPLSNAFNEAISLPGIPLGHITLLRGHSNTSKTTALLELAISAQKAGILPILIITEMKWSNEHARMMGFNMEEEKNDKGEVIGYNGFFIYKDRETLNSVEDVADFISDLLEEQKKGNLPYDLLFLWDSIGSIPCQMSIDSNKSNNEWHANAISTNFGNFINQQIVLSRKESQPYTNTLVCVNKVWVDKPATPFEMPKLKNKGGLTMYSDASLVVTFGNITNAGTQKIKAVKDKKEIEFAIRVRISVDKNHMTGITTLNKVLVTPHGFINDNPKEIEEYKKKYSSTWLQLFNSTDFALVEEEEMKEDLRDIPDESESIK